MSRVSPGICWKYQSISPLSGLRASVHRVRNQKGAIRTAENVLHWLKGSVRMEQPRPYVQDPYSFRCMPQVHGASRDVMAGVKEVLELEMNAVTDNPLVFPDEDRIVSGGNFHGQPLALAMDRLTLAVHEWGSISERRTFKLLSGWEPFSQARGSTYLRRPAGPQPGQAF